MRRLRCNSSHFVCCADQLAQKEGKKPFMKNFRSLDVSGHRARSALASGNFGLGKKNTCFGSPNAQNTTPTPLVCGHLGIYIYILCVCACVCVCALCHIILLVLVLGMEWPMVGGGPLQHATTHCACGITLCSRNFPCSVPVVYGYGTADAT